MVCAPGIPNTTSTPRRTRHSTRSCPPVTRESPLSQVGSDDPVTNVSRTALTRKLRSDSKKLRTTTSATRRLTQAGADSIGGDRTWQSPWHFYCFSCCSRDDGVTLILLVRRCGCPALNL